MSESRLIPSLAAAIIWAFSCLPASAVEVTLEVANESEEFADDLRSASLSVSTAARGDATPQDILAAAQADYARLIGVLYASGYYGPVIRIQVDGREAAEIPPLAAPAQVNQVRILINPRAAFTFSTARVAPLAPGTTLPEDFAPGKHARGALVRQAAQAGVDGWNYAGHAKAKVADQSLVADHARNQLAADIRLAPGPQLTFGDVIVDSESRVRKGRIGAISGLPKGRLATPDEVRQAARRLRRSGAFQSVTLTPSDTVGPGNTLDYHVKVTDAKRRRVGAGIELSSLEGLTVSGFWLHRNMFGGAERLRFDAEVAGIGGDSGGIDYHLSTRFERPATFTADTTLYLMASTEEKNEPDYRERNIEIGGGLSHIFSDTFTGEAGIAYRYSEIDDDLGSRSLQYLIFPTRFTWDARDDSLNAGDGHYLDLHFDPFLGLDRSTTAARLYLDARGYRSFGKDDRITLAARAQIGSVMGATVEDTPPEMLFYSGGAGTVRGQAYQSLAVELGNGLRVGGRSFLGFSGEVRGDVNDKIQAVVFADTGYIGADAWGTDNGNWHSGAGLGARYNTGIGPIRVDLATPLDGDAGKDFELYIGIGQAF